MGTIYSVLWTLPIMKNIQGTKHPLSYLSSAIFDNKILYQASDCSMSSYC